MSKKTSWLTEEHVTRRLAILLAGRNHEIISVHPPDGQGPFVIPKKKELTDIERSSFHPDIVSIGPSVSGKKSLFISECKLNAQDLDSDRQKLAAFASNYESMLFAFLRCKSFEGGPDNAFDYESISQLRHHELPVIFLLASVGENDIYDVEDDNIHYFTCLRYVFNLNQFEN